MRRHLLLGLSILALACSSSSVPVESPSAGPASGVEWALAIHGGAGTIPRDLPEERKAAYLQSLERALRMGVAILDEGGSSLDAVETILRDLEDDPLFNAGRGAVFNEQGGHELDASIMNGADLSCGAVTGVTTVKNPIGLARRVMEQTRHVLLAGAGAELFADEMGVERVEPAYFDTPLRREQLERALERRAAEAGHGTVGAAALDRQGNLAAGTSTGGMTAKRWGRVGDSPIVGAGTYADNRTCAISATGTGEEFIRHGVARAIAARMEFQGLTLAEAAEKVIHGTLRPGDGGIIGVAHDGSIAMVFNSAGMYRAAADSSGRLEVAIWESEETP